MPCIVGMVGNGNGWEWLLGWPNIVLAVVSRRFAKKSCFGLDKAEQL